MLGYVVHPETMPHCKLVGRSGTADSHDLREESRVGQSSSSQVRPIGPSAAGDNVIYRGGRVALVVEMAVTHHLIVLTRKGQSDGHLEPASLSGIHEAASPDRIRHRELPMRAGLNSKYESKRDCLAVPEWEIGISDSGHGTDFLPVGCLHVSQSGAHLT